ncbi:SDR family NAD(P)-dependent oxidoreductase [Marinicella sp. W31]|uniref:SDR family NAD(P)-dependent oxidoreductase n=1 Tax=Marinicella sp. W31 TaxID=3023713 RepID=UPI0037576996
MNKTILITGSTDGIGFETAKSLIELGHNVLIHGRNKEKLVDTKAKLLKINNKAQIHSYLADLSAMNEVKELASQILNDHSKLDVLINNAGVFVVANQVTQDGLDIRYAVNTIAPYLLTQLLMPLLGQDSRVINLSSAAQASIDPSELLTESRLSDGEVYAKSKLGLTMWSFQLAHTLGDEGPVIVAVNPASMIGSKMVNQAYGVAGKSLKIGADVLVKAALSDEFAEASGKYFDNDYGQFRLPHPDATDQHKTKELTESIESVLAKLGH